jgi:hypothetical protein
MVYVNGSASRLVDIYGSVLSRVSWKRFRPWHLLRIGPNDVFLTVRAWDAIAWLYAKLRPERRPLIVQLADGHISELNCKKEQNQRRGGYLYRPLLCDVFISFNRALPNCLEPGDSTRVRYARPCWVNSAPQEIDADTWVLACGNDPFFESASKALVVSAFRNLDQEAQRRNKKIIYSIANRELRELVRRAPHAPDSRRFGEIVLGEPAPGVVFTTPSTIALEAAARGLRVCVLDCWAKDINFPPEMIWNVRDTDAATMLGQREETWRHVDPSTLFGSEQIEGILRSVLSAPGSHKVDLRQSAGRIRFSMANILGSFR